MMNEPDAIVRDPDQCSTVSFDLIIVGAGVYGCFLALEAARRGLNFLLLERDDFGSHTSLNHLRVLHGGLRYLQDFDLARFRESTRERRWFLHHFPELCQPLSCLMPLYGEGVRKPALFKLVFWLDAMLAFDRNRSLDPSVSLKPGKVLSKSQTLDVFPSLQPQLKGGAFWQDGFVKDSPRLLMEVLRWAVRYQGRCLNYFEATEPFIKDGVLCGLCAVDKMSGQSYRFTTSTIINAGGPWSRALAKKWDKDFPELFPQGVLVWNLLFNRPALAQCGLAVRSGNRTGHTYFLVPWKGLLLAGTGHKALNEDVYCSPGQVEIQEMIRDLNDAIPDLNLAETEVLRVFHGVMPGRKGTLLAARSVLIDHGGEKGTKGLYSISGVKFTTARAFADKTLSRIFPESKPQPYGDRFRPSTRKTERMDFPPLEDLESWKRIVREESVLKLSDILLRRGESDNLSGFSKEDLLLLSDLLPSGALDRYKQIDEFLDQYSDNKSVHE